MPGLSRRQLMAATTTLAGLSAGAAHARTVAGSLPWVPNEAYPPAPVDRNAPLVFLTPDEAAAVDAILARLIPADDLGPGAKESGGTIFIDRQLAGPYGGADWLYMQGPFPADPLPSQGLQSPLNPRQQYRQGLAALDAYCRANGGQPFAAMPPADQDKLLAALEKNQVKLPNYDGASLFALLLTNAMEGYFADPAYGGNRDMAGWKLIGFPGARYDFRDVIAKPNQPYTMPPVGLSGRPEWGTRL